MNINVRGAIIIALFTTRTYYQAFTGCGYAYYHYRSTYYHISAYQRSNNGSVAARW